MSDENPQSKHYAAIHDAYQKHYFDASSNAYRNRYIFPPMFNAMQLAGKDVAELACGGGTNALYVKNTFHPAQINGFDISHEACLLFQKNIGNETYCVDLTKPLPELSKTYDMVYVIGGLHHCVLDLTQTMANVSALLKKGGTLIVLEPNTDFFLQKLRDVWYRADRYFDAQSERALSPQEILDVAQGTLVLKTTHYFGGPAYYLILNSLVTRFPRWLKPYLLNALFFLEDAFNRLPGKAPFPAFIAHYKRV